MEEILASIRKAIDEDTRFGANPAPVEVVPVVEETVASPTAQLADDVLGLTRGNRAMARSEPARRSVPRVALVTDEGPSVLRPAFGQARDETVSLSGGSTRSAPLEARNSGGSIEVAAVVPEGFEGNQANGREADMAMEKSRFDHRTSEEEVAASAPSEPEVGATETTVRLADVDAVVSSAFEKLSAQLAESRRKATPTLEDLAKDLMRPVIKQWLDENLSGIVERMVQAEIERVTRRSGL